MKRQEYFTNKAEFTLDMLYNAARDTIVTGYCKASDGVIIWIQVARKAGQSIYNLASSDGDWYITDNFDNALNALAGAL